MSNTLPWHYRLRYSVSFILLEYSLQDLWKFCFERPKYSLFKARFSSKLLIILGLSTLSKALDIALELGFFPYVGQLHMIQHEINRDYFLLGMVYAPLIEEMLFRSWLPIFKKEWLTMAIYLSAIAFGAAHFQNYNDAALNVLPLVVAPQIVSGMILAYVRCRLGLIWSMLTHSFHNGVLISFLWLTLH